MVFFCEVSWLYSGAIPPRPERQGFPRKFVEKIPVSSLSEWPKYLGIFLVVDALLTVM